MTKRHHDLLTDTTCLLLTEVAASGSSTWVIRLGTLRNLISFKDNVIIFIIGKRTIKYNMVIIINNINSNM